MQLTDLEAAELEKAMVDAFNIPELGQMLPLGKRLDLLINTQAIAANLGVIVKQVVQAAQNGWTRSLVEAVFATKPGNPLVAAFYARYQTRVQSLPADLYTTYEVRTGRLFVNRKDLRERLREFSGANTSRVFAVEGADGSGRAYSSRLIEYLTNNGTWYRVDHYDLVEFGRREPIALLNSIFAGLGSSRPVIPERDSREAFELCLAMETELNRRQETLCLVFSRFAGANLHDDTRNFILKLAVQAEKKIKWLRVILLGYDRELPVEIYDEVLRESIHPLTPDDFAECTAGILNRRGIPVSPADVRPDIERCFAQFPVNDAEGRPLPDRLKKIERAVRSYIDFAQNAHATIENSAVPTGGGS